MRGQTHIYNDFMENLSPSLSKLINAAWMADKQEFDDNVVLIFDLDNSYTLVEISGILEENAELTTLYHHIPSNHTTTYGQSLCAYSNPNLGPLYKINAETEEDGKVSLIYVTLYASDERMLADLRVELAEHSRSGLFKRKTSEEELLQQFVCGGVDSRLYERVVTLIREHGNGISVADHRLYMEHEIFINKRTVKRMCRTLVLRESGGNNPHDEEQRWYVADIKIKQALIEYRKKKFKMWKKASNDIPTLTATDVERIIKIATDGEVNLHLIKTA